MGGRRRGAVARWLVPDARPPRWVRLVVFVFGLAALGVPYVLTQSEGLQLLVVFALAFAVLPAVSRRFGVRDEYMQAAIDHNPPLRVLALSIAVTIAGGTLLLPAVAALGLGPWFWFWAFMSTWLEAYVYLAERSLRHDGIEIWTPTRPLRDAMLAGVATAPLIFALALLDGAGIGEAVAAGVACGFVVFAIAGTFMWLSRRAQATSGAPEREPPPD